MQHATIGEKEIATTEFERGLCVMNQPLVGDDIVVTAGNRGGEKAGGHGETGGVQFARAGLRRFVDADALRKFRCAVFQAAIRTTFARRQTALPMTRW